MENSPLRARRVAGPRYLFHWTTAAALRTMAAGATAIEVFPIIKAIPAASVLYRAYPQLRR